MSFDIEKARQTAAALEKVLTPLGKRPVDLNDPNWRSRRSNPLEEAGVSPEADRLLAALLDAYASGDESQRASIRELFAKNPMFAWAACLSEPATTPGGFRRHLLLLSAINGDGDIRDTIVGVETLCVLARRAGVDIGPILAEIEDLSSDVTIHGMASLREVMNGARGRFSS
jgi:hypothetical protein